MNKESEKVASCELQVASEASCNLKPETYISHIPVMLSEVLAHLSPKDGEVYVDGTFGAGGYSKAILKAAECRVFAIDRDPSVVPLAQKLAAEFSGRFVLLSGSFSEMVQLLAAEGIEKVNGVVLDIGVSSMQINTPERGFSFRHDGPLDMRMASKGQTAAEIINSASEKELADIIYMYGEERASRRIAKAIVAARPITRTGELANIIRQVIPKKDAADPATRTFQALRIYVNDELGELEHALRAAETVLDAGGRLVVVTFHSLEDRIMKRFLESRCGEARGASRHSIMAAGPRIRVLPTFFMPRKLKVSEKEAAGNPRARSARLRSAIRSQAEVA